MILKEIAHKVAYWTTLIVQKIYLCYNNVIDIQYGIKMVLDKVSVREKADEIKTIFLQLKQEGKVLPEILALMNGVF